MIEFGSPLLAPNDIHVAVVCHIYMYMLVGMLGCGCEQQSQEESVEAVISPPQLTHEPQLAFPTLPPPVQVIYVIYVYIIW